MRLIARLAVCLFAVAAHAQTPLGTGFTYQGQLQASGSPYAGPADLTFRLYTAASGGSLLGAQSLPGTPTENGRFSVILNEAGQFSTAAFIDSRRWLEISVNGVTLSPRQELTAAPFALESRGIVVGPTGKVGIGDPAPATRLSVLGGLSVFDTANEGISLAANAIALVNRQTEDTVYQYTAAPERHELSAGGAPAVIVNASGSVGIGAEPTADRLAVAGSVHALSGGFVFPDGSTQRTAPRIAAIQTGTFVDVSAGDGWRTVRSFTMTVPGPGSVLLTAVGSMSVTTSVSCDVGLGLTPDAPPLGAAVHAAVDSPATASATSPYTVQLVHPVAATGTVTFYLVADSSSPTSFQSARISSSSITALFIPAP